MMHPMNNPSRRPMYTQIRGATSKAPKAAPNCIKPDPKAMKVAKLELHSVAAWDKQASWHEQSSLLLLQPLHPSCASVSQLVHMVPPSPNSTRQPPHPSAVGVQSVEVQGSGMQLEHSWGMQVVPVALAQVPVVKTGRQPTHPSAVE